MKTIKIGGVPEHFNLPWHLTIEEKQYFQDGLHVEWTEFPGGTGAMAQALRNNEIDMAIILSEGIIKEIIDGNPAKIVQKYIETPLIWGIHVSEKSNYQNIDELEGTTAAISRYGSGSHLMAYVNAQNQGWTTTNLKFNVVKNLEGAIHGLSKGEADYFMWEHFTTKPLVDNHTFRRVSDCPTPWPCFVIAVRDEVLNNDSQEVKTILKIINKATSNFKNIPDIDKILAHRYQQNLQDIQKWISITEWSQKQISEETITIIQDQLLELDIIPNKIAYDNLIFNL